VLWGLAGALGAAVAYGSATILQAIGVRRMATAEPGSSLRARARLGRSYAAGLLLDGIGFLASIAALRTLPLFLVQSAVASSVAVTAILAVVVLGVRLSGKEIAALTGVGLGLVALASSALEGPAQDTGPRAGWWALLAVVPVLAVAVVGLLTEAPTRSSALLAVAAGLAFGLVGIAARILVVPHPLWRVLGEPALWALVAHGALGTIAFAYALDRGRITSAAAITFATETVIPAVIGLRFLGDGVRHHFAPIALLGFVLTLGACLVLASRAERPRPRSPSQVPDHLGWPRRSGRASLPPDDTPRRSPPTTYGGRP
jgi:drug/metabolite transporter (DMT)-like permease